MKVKKVEVYPCGATKERLWYVWGFVGWSPQPKGVRGGCPVHGYSCKAQKECRGPPHHACNHSAGEVRALAEREAKGQGGKA